MLYNGPLIKGLFEPTPWEWKAELAAETELVESDEPPSPNEPNPAPATPPIYCDTIADAKSQSDWTTVKLNCKPAGSTGSGYFVTAEDTSISRRRTDHPASASTTTMLRPV